MQLGELLSTFNPTGWPSVNFPCVRGTCQIRSTYLNYSVVQAVREFLTPNSWNIFLWFFLFQLLSSLSSSAVLNFLEITKNSFFIHVPLITQEIKQFSFFYPPRTLEKLSYDSLSLNSCVVEVVQLGWTTPNHEIFSYNPCFFIYSVVLGSWLALYCLVQLTRTHKIISYEHYSRNYSVLKAVQQDWTIHRTHKLLSYDPSSLNYLIVQSVQQGWSTSN